MSVYVPGKEIRKLFSIGNSQLRLWADSGKIDYLQPNNGRRIYKISDVKDILGYKEANKNKTKIIYCRVSSNKQKEDLKRQVEDLSKRYPNHEVIQDIGSGINWKRKGFIRLLDKVYKREVSEVVVANKDRLCRFAYDLVLEQIFTRFECEVLVDSIDNRHYTQDEELVEDLIAITTVFVARTHGQRSASKKRTRKQEHDEVNKS